MDFNKNMGNMRYKCLMLRFIVFIMFTLIADLSLAREIVFDATVDLGTGSMEATPFVIEKDGITIDAEMGRATGREYRFFWRYSVAISSTIGDISKIVFECVQPNEEQYGPGCFTVNNGSYTYEDYVGTWSGLSSYIVFTSTLAQVRSTRIIVTVRDGATMNVNLPSNISIADYADMKLEITNKNNNEHLHYILSANKRQYSFSNLNFNTVWDVVLLNKYGDIFGKIENVSIINQDVSVEFNSLIKPQNIELSVMTPDSTDVTNLVLISWKDNQGHFLKQGSTIAQLPVSKQLSYEISLPQSLISTYNPPVICNYQVIEDNNRITYHLVDIEDIHFSGKVIDMTTKSPLGDVSISALQSFGDTYTNTTNIKTDANGVYSFDLKHTSTVLSYTGSGYITHKINFDSLMIDSVFELPKVELQPITGAVINIELSYTLAHNEGDTLQAQTWFSDYSNVYYEVYNKTTGNSITNFSLQYPQIVLLEDVNDGDVLELKAISRKDEFNPTKTTVTISEQKANATFNIVELGGIVASFNKNINPQVTGTLYDQNNRLMKTLDYSGNTLKLDNLSDGIYTLITMGKSEFFNTIYDLTEFANIGLVAGEDYVQNLVEVTSGIIKIININEVPHFDESKMYYTGANTSFMANKQRIVVGNYLTFTGYVDFKQEYCNKVQELYMVVELPETCSFIENSVVKGNNNITSSYTYNDNTLIIPLDSINERIRFCVMPLITGDYSPSAFIQFKINNNIIMQPIGKADFSVNGSTIIVPSVINTPNIYVTGTAIGNSTIDVYDGDTMIGQTVAKKNGNWMTVCTLHEPYNLSRHEISAIVRSEDGNEIKSETETCLYDINSIAVSRVKMYYYNPEYHKTLDVTFDYNNPNGTQESYIYNTHNNKFTFTIDFSENDTSMVSDVVLNVKTAKNHWIPLNAVYDSSKEQWVAEGIFGDKQLGDLPVNVSVDFTSKTPHYLDIDQIINGRNEVETISNNYYTDISKLNNLFNQFTDSISDEDYLYICDVMELPHEPIHDIDNEIDVSGWSQERIDAYLDSCYLAFEDELNELNCILDNTNQWFELSRNYQFDNGNDATYIIGDCTGLTHDILVEQGYEVLETTSGSLIYLLVSEKALIMVNLDDNLRISIESSEQLSLLLKNRFSESQFDFELVFSIIKEAINTINTIYGDFLIRLKQPVDVLLKNIVSLEVLLNQAKGILPLAKDPNEIKRLKSLIRGIERTLATTRLVLKYTRPLLRFLAKCIPVANYLATIYSSYRLGLELKAIYNRIPDPCPKEQLKADQYKGQAWAIAIGAASFTCAELVAEMTADIAIAGGAAASIATAGTSLAATGWGIVQKVAAQIGKAVISFAAQELAKKNLIKKVNELDCFDEGGGSNNDSPGPSGFQYPGNDAGFEMDPSGFVYEGVPSNRLQGVTATCYYKETVEDMYGDEHEEVVLWDAENYGQENPLYTDENGYYRWDVPIGMWQVKYEKEGYETTYSDWLPVPPPQLDVNIGMVQMRQPEVINARAYPKAVELEFDKYMLPETLTTDNITVSVNGTNVSGTIELLNAELDDPSAITSLRRAPGTGLTFASRVRFNADRPFNADKVTLHVKQDVKSYADLEMNEDYEAVLDVELEMQEIVADSVIIVPYLDSKQITVAVLPAAASAGKVISVASTSPMIVTTDAEQYTLDSNGEAAITVNGGLPGMTSLLYSIEGYNLTAATLVNVLTENQMTVLAPTATIASGSEVEKGTPVYLKCATPGATIYYTLDGSCPCDPSPARMVYDGSPIIINDDITIKAMATAPDLYDSDVATFVYRVGVDGKRGDVNNDGEVNIVDVNVVINIILGRTVDDQTLQRADVNKDGEINIIDVNDIINIILSPANAVKLKVNCDDQLHINDLRLKPGEVRTLNVTLDHADRYSAMQCDLVLPAGLTLVGVNGVGDNVERFGRMDENATRVVTYSMNKQPFAGIDQTVLTLSVRADAALASLSEILMENVVLSDNQDQAWRVADCVVKVNNASGIDDLSAIADRVWVEGRSLCINTQQNGTAHLVTVNGIALPLKVSAGVTRYDLEPGIYVVVLNGNSYKIAVRN